MTFFGFLFHVLYFKRKASSREGVLKKEDFQDSLASQKWVNNELVPFFLGPEEVCQSAIQSDDSFKSYRGNRRRQRKRRQQTDTVVKTVFFSIGRSQNG